ncbi:gluconate 2-dehydrogenase subunit 3 family protein [Aureitalea marina]|uniref:Gluconate 2-dehydrogenase subunit 3 family protein n=1 Tax=Aureitalea marina TaxID=930804 RepID=A0A2S7KRQ5_9FLAO|nr:gluconate 2-dehydrogenase subunit 3 family protein [Aureitalea marina]PQB05312.1 hypothetical protein BST85_10770 [Aureitalea marina]
MDRRQALKSLGYGAGFLVATPTVVSLLQSCANEPDFQPVFLSVDQGYALKHMVDLIIPSDPEVPGAVDIGAHNFIDAYWNEVTPTEHDLPVAEVQDSYGQLRQHLPVLWTQFETLFNERYQKGLGKGTVEDYDALLAEFLAFDPEKMQAYGKEMDAFYRQADPNNFPAISNEAAASALLGTIRGMTVWAWKSSEQIGKNVLWYDPVPGQQLGCINLGQAGNNGKAMAL